MEARFLDRMKRTRNWEAVLPGKTQLPSLIVAVVFVLCLVLSRTWFDAGSSVGSRSHLLAAVTNITGYTFLAESVSSDLIDTLKTSQILSGTFSRVAAMDFAPRSVRVFLATWTSADHAPLVMLGHTPDICWRGAGWMPIDLGQPKTVPISISSFPPKRNPILSSSAKMFELRIFASPAGDAHEIVVWIPLVGGQPVRAIGSAPDPGDQWQTYLARSMQFLGLVQDRVSVGAGRQFIRFSMPLTSDWQSAVNQLRAFALLWLRGGA